MPVHEDQHYVDALCNNDHKGITAIYERFSETVKAFVLKNNGNEHDARDIMQEALVIITRQARQNNLQLHCPFGAYLFLVVKGRWLNELKRRKRSAVTIEGFDGYVNESDAAELADKTLEENQREQLFWTKFKELGARCRQLLGLSWSNNSMERVAEIMGVSYGYARKKKTECISRLVTLIKASAEYASLQTKTDG